MIEGVRAMGSKPTATRRGAAETLLVAAAVGEGRSEKGAMGSRLERVARGRAGEEESEEESELGGERSVGRPPALALLKLARRAVARSEELRGAELLEGGDDMRERRH